VPGRPCGSKRQRTSKLGETSRPTPAALRQTLVADYKISLAPGLGFNTISASACMLGGTVYLFVPSLMPHLFWRRAALTNGHLLCLETGLSQHARPKDMGSRSDVGVEVSVEKNVNTRLLEMTMNRFWRNAQEMLPSLPPGARASNTATVRCPPTRISKMEFDCELTRFRSSARGPTQKVADAPVSDRLGTNA
jgi:hypothetical protein